MDTQLYEETAYEPEPLTHDTCKNKSSLHSAFCSLLVTYADQNPCTSNIESLFIGCLLKEEIQENRIPVS